jgi:hypothetical protein
MNQVNYLQKARNIDLAQEGVDLVLVLDLELEQLHIPHQLHSMSMRSHTLK